MRIRLILCTGVVLCTLLPVLSCIQDYSDGGGTTTPSRSFGTMVWGTPELVETNDIGTASRPHVAGNGTTAIAVWSHMDGASRYSIWANRYVDGTGWETPQLIEWDDTGGAGQPHVAFYGSGKALAVWTQNDGVRYNIWANRYVAGTGWGTPELIESGTSGDDMSPQIASNGAGEAVCAWLRNDGIEDHLWANRYVEGAGWGTPVLLEPSTTDTVRDHQVGIDAAGNAIAVWSQLSSGSTSTWVNRYVAGVGWGTAALIESDDTDHTLEPQLAVGSNGDAVAVWPQSDGATYNIWAAHYMSAVGWFTPQLLETDNAGEARSPQVVLDASGHPIVVWHQDDGSRYNLCTNRFNGSTGWGTAGAIETGTTHARWPSLAVCGAGNAVAVWQQVSGGRESICSNRLVAGIGWGTEELIETDNTGDAVDPLVVILSNGTSLAVWRQFDGVRNNVWSNIRH